MGTTIRNNRINTSSAPSGFDADSANSEFTLFNIHAEEVNQDDGNIFIEINLTGINNFPANYCRLFVLKTPLGE